MKTLYFVKSKQDFQEKLSSLFTKQLDIKIKKGIAFKIDVDDQQLTLDDDLTLHYEIRSKAATGDLYVKWKLKGKRKASGYFILAIDDPKKRKGPPPITENYRND